jgi:hypothetical protein
LGRVFRWYWGDRERVRALYPEYYEQFVFSLAPKENIKNQEEQFEPPTFIIEEGVPAASSGTKRKRSQKLIEKGREHFRKLDPDGKLRCKACGFTSPGSIGTKSFTCTTRSLYPTLVRQAAH